MKKFLLKLLLFAVIVAAADFVGGMIADAMQSRARGGDPQKSFQLKTSVAPDILVLGSSRAVHHYRPDILADSLDRTVYIAGEDGNGIVLMEPLLHVIASRRKPQIVVYDIMPKFDLDEDDMHRYLPGLRQLWGSNPEVDRVVGEVNGNERFKLMSRMFRYNSKYPSLLKGMIIPERDWFDGYAPRYGAMDSIAIQPPTTTDQPRSPFKVELLDRLAGYCRDNDIKLVMIYSPSYYPLTEAQSRFISEWCEDNGINFYDYGADSRFTTADYNDVDHLNDDGAVKFTRLVINQLRDSLP